jgi:hypothetical protein
MLRLMTLCCLAIGAGVAVAQQPAAEAPAAEDDSLELFNAAARCCVRRFAAVVDQKQDSHELRLLPRPLYRYPAAGEASSDGALFAFVQATDPELLLLLEVQATRAGPAWHYGLARMTDLALDVKLDGRSAWKVDPWDWRKRHPSHMYIKFTQKVRR